MDLNNFFIQGGLIKYGASRHACNESWIPAVQATARKTQQRCTTTVNTLILFWMESHSHQLFTHSGVKIWQQTLDWRHWEGLQKRMSLLGRTGLSWENKSCCLDKIFYNFFFKKMNESHWWRSMPVMTMERGESEWLSRAALFLQLRFWLRGRSGSPTAGLI